MCLREKTGHSSAVTTVWDNNKRRATARRSKNVSHTVSGSTLDLGGGVIEVSHFREANLLEQIPALLEKNFVRGIGATFHS